MTETGKNNLEGRLAELEERIESYKRSLGVPKIAVVPDQYLQASQEEMRGMPRLECITAAIQLEQYAFYLQEEINKLGAIIVWAESNVKSIIADKLDQYSGYSYEERKNKAVKDNNVAQKLEGLKVEYTIRKTSILDLINRVGNIARYYNEMSRLK